MNALKVSVLTFLSALSIVQSDLTKSENNQWRAIMSIPSGKALDVSFYYASIRPFKYSGTQIYQFKAVNAGPGVETEYQIAESNNDMVLSLDDDNVGVILRHANRLYDRQLWYVKKIRSDEVLIVNKWNGWCLDVYKDYKHTGSIVKTWKCADHRFNQYWVFLKLC